MRGTQQLHDVGQSLWLDNITRDLLTSGTLTATSRSSRSRGSPRTPRSSTTPSRTAPTMTTPSARSCKEGKSGEALFFDLALEDLTQAADLFRPIHDRTNGVDGWVSLEVSPLLAHDTASTLAAAKDFTPGRGGPTSSSRSPAPRRASPPSRRRSSPACRST